MITLELTFEELKRIRNFLKALDWGEMGATPKERTILSSFEEKINKAFQNAPKGYKLLRDFSTTKGMIKAGVILKSSNEPYWVSFLEIFMPSALKIITKSISLGETIPLEASHNGCKEIVFASPDEVEEVGIG